MKNFACLLEEPSAKELSRIILPKILPKDYSIKYIVFEGKQDLERSLVKRLHGWRLPETWF